MFTLHGRQIRCGIKPAAIPLSLTPAPAAAFFPFPTLQSISLTLPAGLQNIIQIGAIPLRDIVSITVENPVEATVSCLLDETYPNYGALLSFFSKDASTKHFPLVDMRISLGRIFHDGRNPTIELRCGVARGLSVRADEGAASIEFQFTFPIGFLLPHLDAAFTPPFWVTAAPPARKIFMVCTATNKRGVNVFGDTAATVTSFSLSAQISNSFSQTLPNILQALSSPILPSSVYAIIHEGPVTYTANLTMLLPPHIEIPPVTTLPIDVTLSFTTLNNFSLILSDAKIQQVSPTLAVGSRQQVALTLWGKKLTIAPPP